MTRRQVQALGLLERVNHPAYSSGDVMNYGSLRVVYAKDVVWNVQLNIGCEGGGVRLSDGTVVRKGRDFEPYLRAIPGCTLLGEVPEGGAGNTYICGARRTQLDLVSTCERVLADGTCGGWVKKRDMIRIAISSKGY